MSRKFMYVLALWVCCLALDTFQGRSHAESCQSLIQKCIDIDNCSPLGKKGTPAWDKCDAMFTPPINKDRATSCKAGVELLATQGTCTHSCCKALVECYSTCGLGWKPGDKSRYSAECTINCNQRCPSDQIANSCLDACHRNASCLQFYK